MITKTLDNVLFGFQPFRNTQNNTRNYILIDKWVPNALSVNAHYGIINKVEWDWTVSKYKRGVSGWL